MSVVVFPSGFATACTHLHPFRAALTFGRVSSFFVCDAEWWRWNRWNLFYSLPLSLSLSQGWQIHTCVTNTCMVAGRKLHLSLQTHTHVYGIVAQSSTVCVSEWLGFLEQDYLNRHRYFEVSHTASPPSLVPVVRVELQCSHAFHYR